MRTLIALLLIILLLGCTTSEKTGESPQSTTSPPPATVPAQEQEKTYRSDKLGFFLAPRGSYGTANINVAREESNLSLAEYAEEMKSNIASLLKNYTLLDEGELRLKGYEAHELVYTYVQGPYTIKNHAVFVKAGNSIYLITLASLPEEFEKNEEVFERFLESFRANP